MYEKLTLPNGLRIVYENMPFVRSAAVGIWIGAGSRCEKRSEGGAAHFIEHMLFKGTSRRSAAELAGIMDGVGGQINAFTTRENTCFYARVLDSHLELAVDLLSEMFFESLLSDADADNERGVIAEEIDMYDDTPEDLVVERLLARCFPGALGRPVLGGVNSLQKLDGAALRHFMEREYRPERIVVSLCGSFSERHLRRIEGKFSNLQKRRGTALKESAYTPSVTAKRKVTEQNHFCLGWKGLPTGDEKRFAVQLMSTVLGGGMSSRLFQAVREKHGLCYSIGSFTAAFAETGFFGISTATGRETEYKALGLIAEELEKFRQDGATEAEVDRSRELMKASLVMAMESTSSRMNRLGGGELQIGRCLSVDEIIDRYDAVTREDVLAAARGILDPAFLSLSAVGRVADPGEYIRLMR